MNTPGLMMGYTNEGGGFRRWNWTWKQFTLLCLKQN